MEDSIAVIIHMLINKILQKKKESKKLLIHTNNVDSSINIVFLPKSAKKECEKNSLIV